MSMFHGNLDTPMDLSVKTRRKLRLEEFLRQNLDHAPADRVIQWVDREQGIFRILWTHQSSGAFTQEDAALFRYWALARGKPANLSSVELKQSLRMALNKSPSVERVPATHDEYRYFRFTDWGSRRSEQRTPRSQLDVENYESGHSAFHSASSPAMFSSFNSESDNSLDDRYTPYRYHEDLSLRDSLVNSSPSDSSSLSSYSVSPSIPSDIFQVQDDPYGAHGSLSGQYKKQRSLNYLRGSPDAYQVSRDPALMHSAYSVPSAANLLHKEETETCHSLYDDTLYSSPGQNHNFLSPAALLALNNSYGLFYDAMTIDRRKHNLLP